MKQAKFPQVELILSQFIVKLITGLCTSPTARLVRHLTLDRARLIVEAASLRGKFLNFKNARMAVQLPIRSNDDTGRT
ncbi:hypothetical protein PGT21_016845 [Puccinia graminis f. sp. tritici]|uniref:Uncharacterized protein n=1 Tax=Puccinia graminis f. sp. tritici TaxID=56615 RepID=A0A5B0LTP5_PUCGR|nr:hypothetical protein PGT21_016845 [Puccinia graminis f. sp. tritici]